MAIKIDWETEIVASGPKNTFTFEGSRYYAWVRLYGDGSQDVEVESLEDPELQCDEEVYEYAGKLFLSRGNL
jgi:hypothetical protein